MKRVFSSHNQILVHHFRNVLEAENVKTELRNLALSSAMGELPPAECEAQVWVLNDADAPRAAELLSRPPAQGPEWMCACGEKLGAQFSQCWNCGAYRT